MADIKKIAMKNSFTGLLSQIISMFFLFVTRNLFIKYIGIELLGLNGTFTSILQTLSLAELGFQTAIVHSMYKPLAENDRKSLNDIVNAFKYIYRTIGLFFIIATICVCPFLNRIITGIEVTGVIYVYFIVQSMSSVATYFLAYKRSLLFADQKDYISKIIDMIVNIIACAMQVLAIVVCQSYLLYIMIKVFQVIVSNIIVHIACNKIYPYLKNDTVNKELLKSLWIDVKSIFVGKIASYVYTSTPNLVISIFIRTSLVGFLTNYTVIITNLKTLLNCLVSPVAPIVGKSIAEKQSAERQYKLLSVYTHFRYVLSLGIIIPIIILISTFISFWVGANFVLPQIAVYLISAEFYIHLVHSALCDYINGEGLFNQEKYISIIAAISNLIVSVFFAITIGLEGVLLGTLVSQGIFWIGRSIIVFKYCFSEVPNIFVKYWFEQIKYIIVFAVLTILCQMIYSVISIDLLILRFIVGGVVCEIIIICAYILIFGRSQNFKEFLCMVKQMIRKEN